MSRGVIGKSRINTLRTIDTIGWVPIDHHYMPLIAKRAEWILDRYSLAVFFWPNALVYLASETFGCARNDQVNQLAVEGHYRRAKVIKMVARYKELEPADGGSSKLVRSHTAATYYEENVRKHLWPDRPGRQTKLLRSVRQSAICIALLVRGDRQTTTMVDGAGDNHSTLEAITPILGGI